MHGTVDHFHPKSIRPRIAYEWSNYRLAYEKMNAYKGDSTAVLDPFTILPGWFVLDFSNFLVKAGSGLNKATETAINTTISRLRLNRDDSLVRMRHSVVKEYATGHIDLDFIRGYYPFIASELERQNLTETIKQDFQ